MKKEEMTMHDTTKGNRRKSGRRVTLRTLLDGTLLADRMILDQLPFIAFLALLAMIYIGNRYHAEKVVRETTRLKKEIQELRAESISVSAELMYKSTKSQVLRAIRGKGLDLKESRVPPKKIVVGKKER